MAKLKRFYIQNACYFVTTTTLHRQRLFVSEEVNKTLLEALDFCRGRFAFAILGYVILPDHMHMLLLQQGEANITRMMHSFKRYTGTHIKATLGMNTEVWQHRFYDHVIRDDADFHARLDYMHGNPVKHQMVRNIDDYRWSSWKAYFLDDHLDVRVNTEIAPPRLETVATRPDE